MARSFRLLHMMQHAIAGLLLIMTGYANMAVDPMVGTLLVILGVLVFSLLLLVRLWGNRIGLSKVILLFVESLALIFAAYLSFRIGKHYLPFAILLAALGYLFAAIVHLRKRNSITVPPKMS